MKTTTTYILLLFLSLAAMQVKSQELSSPDSIVKYRHAIGAGAGFTTGLGLSYRYQHIPSRLGIQMNLAPFNNANVTMLSAGLTLLYKLIESSKSNLFLYQGNHYYYNSEITFLDPLTQISYSEKPVLINTIREKRTQEYFNNGLGIGLELIFIKRISFNLMGGYAAYNNFKYLSFTGETGLYFKF